MADNAVRFLLLYHAVTNLDANGFAAIRAGGVDLNRFPGEKPADRQRFEGSLAKPLLLPIDRNSELRGKVIERCKRYDQVTSRVQPARDACFKERVH